MSQPNEGHSTTQSVPFEVDIANPLVAAITGNNSLSGNGVLGTSGGGAGVQGFSWPGPGVLGNSENGFGVQGTSVNGSGMHGTSETQSPNHAGVLGENVNGGYGISGSTNSYYQPGPSGIAGVWGNNTGSGTGVKGTSQGGDAVAGFSSSNGHAGVAAINDSGGFGLWARGTPAGHFQGNVEVTGDLCLINQDCAEDFEVTSTEVIEPGTVMVIDRDGALQISECAYDKRVAGVISGAGNFKPAIILGRRKSQERTMPIALVGRVYCKADASASPIEVGDLLTTSPTAGYAMKALDPLKSFGAVIGKALRPLPTGSGLIPILIALQ
jgi:hypothetical protein